MVRHGSNVGADGEQGEQGGSETPRVVCREAGTRPMLDKPGSPPAFRHRSMRIVFFPRSARPPDSPASSGSSAALSSLFLRHSRHPPPRRRRLILR